MWWIGNNRSNRLGDGKRKDSMAHTHDAERESGTQFLPKFGADGLLTGVVVDAASREVLMVAHLDREALDATLKTGLAHLRHAVVQGRDQRECAAGARDSGRLRSGCAGDPRRACGPGMPHGRAQLLLSPADGRPTRIGHGLTFT